MLGQPRFAIGDEAFRFSARPKALPLLCYLLLHRDRPVSRDSLAFLLWEDDEEEKARANLRRHIHEIGQVLPPAPLPWIVTDAETVAWNPSAAVWLDVVEFERQAAAGELAAAVEIYAGDLLENLYDEWLFGPRDRLRNAYLAALAELVHVRRAARDFVAAADYAARLLFADPWREDIVRQLMAVRYESGDRAGALQTFESFARLLRAEMDVEPMPETIAMRDVIVRNETAEGRSENGSPDEVPPRSKTIAALPFIGRERELEQLIAAWSRAARGRGSALLVSGEAGIGKTRLVSQLALRAEAEGGRVLWGATSSPESVAYQSLVDGLRNALPMIASASLRPLLLASLAQIVPEIRSRFPELPKLQPIEPERERTRLFDAVATAFESLAAPRPLVLVLEDLHWAETATIAALEFLIARVARRSILLVGTYRNEEVPRVHALHDLRRRLQPERLLAHVSVPRLGREAVAELLATFPRAAAAAAVDDVYAITEGNPLFVGEVLRNIAEGATLALAPATLHDLIVARFERLSPPARELAGIAATIGEAFDVDVLRETSSWNEPALLEAIDELQDRSIIREPVGRHRFDYAFTHHLVQRTINASSSPEVRKRRHRRIARVMEDLFASRLDVAAADIARHHECGGNVAKAAERYVHAARAATAVFATDEALAHARKAASLAGEDGALRFSALAIAELMDDRLCDRNAQRTDLEELETLARASGDGAQICHILWRRVCLCRACGDRDAEYAAILELKAQALSAGDPRWLGEAFEAEGTYFELIGNPAAALLLARQAAEHFDAAGDLSGLVSALTLQASTAAYVGAIEEADGCIVRALDVAQSALNPILTMRVLRCEANVCHWFERWTRHDDVLREALALARSVGDRETEATCLGAVAVSGLRFARFREARTAFADSAAMFQAIEKPQGLATVSLNASALEIEAGLWERALALLDRAEQLALRCNWRNGEGLCYVNRGMVFQLREDFVTARSCSDKARALAIQVNNDRLLGLALRDRGVAEMGLGDAPAAVVDLLDACRLFERLSALEPLLEARAELAQAYWSAGERGSAVALALELIGSHEGDATTNRFAPFRTAWAVALVLRKADEQSAAQILQRSYQLLVDRRDAYEDEESRVAFMRIPIHERIVAAHERDEWPMP